jgi:hypothetical protein
MLADNLGTFDAEELDRNVEDLNDNVYLSQDDDYQDYDDGETPIDDEDDENDEDDDEEDYNEDGETLVDYNDDETALDINEVSFEPFIDSLVENNILKHFPDEEIEDSVEGFNKLIDFNVQKQFEEVIFGLSPLAQKLLEVELNGGDIKELLNEDVIEDYSQYDLEDEDTSKELIRRYNVLKGLDSEDIIDLIEKAEEKGTLLQKAEQAQNELIRYQERLLEESEQKALEEKNRRQSIIEDDIKENFNIINSVDEIAGIKLTRADKEAFKDYLHKPYARLTNGVIVTKYELDTLDKEAKLEMAFRMMQKDAIVSAAASKAENKMAKSIQKELSKRTIPNYDINKEVKTRRTNDSVDIEKERLQYFS